MYMYLVVSLLMLLIALLIWGRVERHWIGLLLLVILIASGCVTIGEAVRFIDWDVIGLIVGVAILTAYLERSGFTLAVAKRITKKLGHSLYKLTFSLALVAGLISVFMENVSVVILLYPVVFHVSSLLGVEPVIPTIIVALSANIAGSATMVGDPPALITAGAFNLAFTDFIIYKGRPSMFFFTISSMILAITLTSYLYSRDITRTRPSPTDTEIPQPECLDRIFIVESLFFLAVKILLLSMRTVVPIPLSVTAAISAGGLTLARALHRDHTSIRFALKHGLEWKLLLFLMSIFVLSGAFEKHGVAQALAEAFLSLSKGQRVVAISLLLWLCVALSSVIDNVPITLTMIPVVRSLSAHLNVDPVITMWSTLIGVTLGGNFTYIGASANVTAVRLLEKNGFKVSFREFIRVSIIYNIVSVVSAWLLYILFYFII